MTAIWILIFTAFASAQDLTPVHVEWYKPEMRISDRPGTARVLLSGKTIQGAKVRLAQDAIPAIDKDGKVKMLPAKDALVEPEAQADDRGLFDLKLDLPFSSVQLPIEVTGPSGAKRNYQLALNVSRDAVQLTNQRGTKGSPYARRTWGLWVGLGFNYLKYDQVSPDIPSSLTLESFDAPTFYGKIVRSLNQEVAFQATFNRAPGRTSSSDTVKISQGSYNWTYLTGEFTFYHPRWKLRYKKYFSELGVQFGLQYHIVPFFARSSATDPTVVSMETNDILLTAVGVTWLIHYDRYWLLETFMRYQVPHQSGSLFDIRYNFAFDGSVGLIYKWKPDVRGGIFWYGQWHDYRFDNHRDKYFEANGGGGPNVSGDQSLFFSNIEARVGWEFD